MMPSQDPSGVTHWSVNIGSHLRYPDFMRLCNPGQALPASHGRGVKDGTVTCVYCVIKRLCIASPY